MDVLEHLLRASPPQATVPSLGAWLDRLTTCPFEEPIDRALWSGFEADRLGYAFVGGYQAALERLLMREPSRHARLSLAATEAGGAHPRSIQTVLAEEGGRLIIRGEKTFATLASVADELLVVASRGLEVDGRNRLVLVRIRKHAPGLSIEDRPPTPFAPEIPHSRVRLVNVGVTSDDIFPDDGYTAYLKPFRTIEDTHVVAATLAYMVGIARTHGRPDDCRNCPWSDRRPPDDCRASTIRPGLSRRAVGHLRRHDSPHQQLRLRVGQRPFCRARALGTRPAAPRRSIASTTTTHGGRVATACIGSGASHSAVTLGGGERGGSVL